MPAKLTGPLRSRSATSIIAVTAKRPLVLMRMVFSLSNMSLSNWAGNLKLGYVLAPAGLGLADAPVNRLTGTGQAAVDQGAQVLVDVFNHHRFSSIQLNLNPALGVDTPTRTIHIGQMHFDLLDK
jgi:hypothetical protein